MSRTAHDKPDWSAIDTVLLDLDGTLLDLAFDNEFWRERIPEAYAQARGVSVADARAALTPVFRAREGTLDWYCIEYWSRELDLDVAQLKRQSAARIAWLPGARDTLETLRARGKRLALVTNAHPQALAIKDQATGVTALMDAVYSSHRFGAPKEHAQFWQAVSASEGYDPKRTLFADDSAPVLAAARASGIRWVYAIRHPDSRADRREHEHLPAVDRLSELL